MNISDLKKLRSVKATKISFYLKIQHNINFKRLNEHTQNYITLKINFPRKKFC